MQDEEDRPRPTRRAHVVGEPLDAISAAELEARIEDLEAEIVRLRGALAARDKSRSAAEAVFKLSQG